MNRYTYASVDGKVIRFSNLEKNWFPDAGLKKKAVIEYYRKIAPVLLPYLRDRPLTLKRYPDGEPGDFFYEKRCPSHAPKWVTRLEYRDIKYCVVDDLPSLLWSVNTGNLEFHPMLCRGEDPDSSDFIVFDLDPGEPAGLLECAKVALLLKDELEELELEAFPKTSGQKGIQVYAPLNSGVPFAETKRVSKEIANRLEENHPEMIVSRMKKTLRKGKVYVDWVQNDPNKSTVCVYSLRAVPDATVSTPLRWNEVTRAASSGKREAERRLAFTTRQVLQRVERYGDLFEPVIRLKQKLRARGRLQEVA